MYTLFTSFTLVILTGRLFQDTSTEKRQRHILGALLAKSTTFEHFCSVHQAGLRPIKKSSLKLEKSEWYSCRSFDVKERWGMHFNIVVLKLKPNESE